MHLLTGAVGAVEDETAYWVTYSGGTCHEVRIEGILLKQRGRSDYWTLTDSMVQRARPCTHHEDPTLHPDHQPQCSYW